jgi:diguanylate cyclase (GGDEF)-like protein
MGDGLRTVRVVTTDEALLASARASVSALDGWELDRPGSLEELVARPPIAGDVVLIDSRLRGPSVYEECRRLGGRLRCRTFIVVEQGNRFAPAIARFCGATGVLERPLTPSALRAALEASGGPRPPLPAEGRSDTGREAPLPETLLTHIASGERDKDLVAALIDPSTGLFNYAFLNYKLDEEFKRARRFERPLACVMLGFEGQASDDILRELAGIFLASCRDTDVLGRFDESSFLFLLPDTGPDGATIMAQRVAEMAEERGLTDLVGDPLTISVGISTYPHPDLARREDLYGSAREAFFAARADGGGVIVQGV